MSDFKKYSDGELSIILVGIAGNPLGLPGQLKELLEEVARRLANGHAFYGGGKPSETCVICQKPKQGHY